MSSCVAHGFGMIEYITESGGLYTYNYKDTDLPLAYSHFIEDYTNRQRMTSIPVNSIALKNFLQSDDLHFVGTFVEAYASDPYPKIYAPNPIDLGSSISHIDETTYQNVEEEAIMTPIVNQGLACHRIGSIATGILSDLGWGEDLGTGIEDDFEFMADIDCEDSPSNELIPTETHFFRMCYTDYAPYNASPDYYEWDLELYYIDDSNNMHSYSVDITDIYGSQNTNPNDHWYSMYVPSLPIWTNGNTWLRNIDGTVKGKLSVFASSPDDEYFLAEMDMKIIYRPSIPLTEIASQGCTNATIEFYSRGATNYKIHYGTTSGGPYNQMVNVPNGTFAYTFSGLGMLNSYYFIVEAVNDSAESTWGPQVKKNNCCGGGVSGGYPNPASQDILFTTKIGDGDSSISEENFEIEEVSLYNINNPNLNKTVVGNGSQEVNVPVYDLPTGVYTVKMVSTQCGVLHSQIIKQ